MEIEKEMDYGLKMTSAMMIKTGRDGIEKLEEGVKARKLKEIYKKKY